MKRYCDILKGRIALELLYLPGITERQYELLGEKALCYGLEFLHRLDIVHQFPFVPREFAQTLHRSLFSFGDIISSLLNLGMKRVDIFFEQLPSFSPLERCRKLQDGISLFVTSLLLVQHHLSTLELFCLVTQKLLSTQVLSVADHMQEFARSSRSMDGWTGEEETNPEVIVLDEYEESVLLQHMESIYHWQRATAEIVIDVETRTIHHPPTALRNQIFTVAEWPPSLQLLQTATNLTQTLSSTALALNSSNNHNFISGPDGTNTSATTYIDSQHIDSSLNGSHKNTNKDSNNTSGNRIIRVPASELEAFRFACDASARSAMLAIVHRYYVQSHHLLLQSMFIETKDGWIGGILITAWLNRVHQWYLYIAAALPTFLQRAFMQEVCRMVLVMYWQRLVDVYQQQAHSSSSFSLSLLSSKSNISSSSGSSTGSGSNMGGMFSEQGQLQIQDDCQRMQEWMRTMLRHSFTQSMADVTSATPTSTVLPGASASVVSPEITILTIWQQFSKVSDPSQQLLPLFADTVYLCGLPCVLYLYDMLRLFLKMKRSTSSGSLLTDNQRHMALAVCEEFIYQLLQQPGVKEDGLISGSFAMPTTLEESKTNGNTLPGAGYARILPLCEALCPSLLPRHVFVTGSKWKWLARPSLTLLWSIPLSSLGHSGSNSASSSGAAGSGVSSGTPNTSGLVSDAYVLQVTLQVTELCNRVLAQRRAQLEQQQQSQSQSSLLPSLSSSVKGPFSESSTENQEGCASEGQPLSALPPPRPARRRSSTNPSPLPSAGDTIVDDSLLVRSNVSAPVIAHTTESATETKEQLECSDSNQNHDHVLLRFENRSDMKPANFPSEQPTQSLPVVHPHVRPAPPPPPPRGPPPYHPIPTSLMSKHHVRGDTPSSSIPKHHSQAHVVKGNTNPFGADDEEEEAKDLHHVRPAVGVVVTEVHFSSLPSKQHPLPLPSSSSTSAPAERPPTSSTIASETSSTDITTTANAAVYVATDKKRHARPSWATAANDGHPSSGLESTHSHPIPAPIPTKRHDHNPTRSRQSSIAASESPTSVSAPIAAKSVLANNNATVDTISATAASPPSWYQSELPAARSVNTLPGGNLVRRHTITAPASAQAPIVIAADVSRTNTATDTISDSQPPKNESESNATSPTGVPVAATSSSSLSTVAVESQQKEVAASVVYEQGNVPPSSVISSSPAPIKPQRRASAAPILVKASSPSVTEQKRDGNKGEQRSTAGIQEDTEAVRRQAALRKLLTQAQAQVQSSITTTSVGTHK